VVDYLATIGLSVFSLLRVKYYLLETKNTQLASYFLLATILFSLLVVKEFLEMCWIKTAISDHVFKLDLKSYLFDEKKLMGIKEDIHVARKIHLEHFAEVDVKDLHLHVLFDERFSEENIRKIKKQKTASPEKSVSEAEGLELDLPKPREGILTELKSNI
jgi:hypothetical protein